MWRNAVLARDGYRCRECGLHDPTGKQLEADHIVPLAAGGAKLDVTNGRALCRACHSAKTKEGARR